jgi:hypothetical protein
MLLECRARDRGAQDWTKADGNEDQAIHPIGVEFGKNAMRLGSRWKAGGESKSWSAGPMSARA